MSVYGEIGTQGTQPLACINSSFPPIPAVHFPLWLHLCCGKGPTNVLQITQPTLQQSSRCAGDKHSNEPRLVEKGFPQSQWLTIIVNIKLPFWDISHLVVSCRIPMYGVRPFPTANQQATWHGEPSICCRCWVHLQWVKMGQTPTKTIMSSAASHLFLSRTALTPTPAASSSGLRTPSLGNFSAGGSIHDYTIR